MSFPGGSAPLEPVPSPTPWCVDCWQNLPPCCTSSCLSVTRLFPRQTCLRSVHRLPKRWSAPEVPRGLEGNQRCHCNRGNLCSTGCSDNAPRREVKAPEVRLREISYRHVISPSDVKRSTAATGSSGVLLMLLHDRAAGARIKRAPKALCEPRPTCFLRAGMRYENAARSIDPANPSFPRRRGPGRNWGAVRRHFRYLLGPRLCEQTS